MFWRLTWRFWTIFVISVAVAAVIGVLLAPILPGWETANSARAYAEGHVRAGLWTEEQAAPVIAEANFTLLRHRIFSGILWGAIAALSITFGRRGLRPLFEE